MGRSGVAVDETIGCPFIASGVATERMLSLGATEYRAVSVGANRFQFARTYRPTWAIVVGVLLTPIVIGLFFFLIRTSETWSATVEEDHLQVRVRVNGRVLPGILVGLREALGARGDVVAPMAGGVLASVPVQTPPAFVGAPPSVAPAPPAAPPPPPPPGPQGMILPPPGATPPPVAPQPVSPSAAPVPVMAAATAPSAPSPAVEADQMVSDETHMVVRSAPTSPAGYLLRFDTGEIRPVDGVVLIGRDPAPGDADVDPLLVAIDDPDRSVSKTHVAVRKASNGLWILDRDSTNGTVVESADGERTVLEGRRASQVHAGWTVHFGERSFQVVAAD